MKFPFDYFVICKPVVEPLRVVTQRNWLECKHKYYVYPFPCVGGDWLLLAGRVCPFLVIIFMDTALFYQITITIFGITRGMFKLDLGVLTSWDEVVTEFYRAPARWVTAGSCMVCQHLAVYLCLYLVPRTGSDACTPLNLTHTRQHIERLKHLPLAPMC